MRSIAHDDSERFATSIVIFWMHAVPSAFIARSAMPTALSVLSGARESVNILSGTLSAEPWILEG